ncbi:MAG: hypothetical protein AB1758_14345, partial [Candidatus Eremiobacterota bacterium]
ILGQQEVRITTFTADPAEFDPVTVERVLFNAGTEISGFTETPIYDWSFRILNPDGSDLLSLDSPGGGPGFGFEWNGRNGDNILASGTYTAEVTVVARFPSDPTVRPSDTKTLSIQVGEGSEEPFTRLFIYDEDGALLASSEPEVLDPPFPERDPIAEIPPDVVVDARFRNLSNNSFLNLRRDQNRAIRHTLDILIQTGANQVSPIRVNVKLSHSVPQGIDVPVRFTGSDVLTGTKNFAGQVTLAGTTDAPRQQLGVREGENNTFSSYDQTSDSVYDGRRYDDYPNWQDSDAFTNREREFGRLFLGRATYHEVDKRDPTLGYPVSVPPTWDAFRVAGYETLSVEDPVGKKNAWLRVPNQAHTWYVSGHGTHDSGRLAGFSPESVSNSWENVDIAIFAGCSVLDIGHFNEDVTIECSNHRFTTSGAGQRWYRATKDGSVLLGYNGSAPLSLTDSRIPIKADTQVVNAFYRNRSHFAGQDPERLAMAWIEANLELAGLAVAAGSIEYHNACAITQNYYYFVRVYVDDTDGDGEGDVVIGRQVWRVHRDLWNKEGSDAFEQLRKDKDKRLKRMDSRFNIAETGRRP